MIHCFLVSSDKHEDAKYMHAKYMHAIYACDLYDDDCPKYTRNICCDPADPGPRGNGGHPQHHLWILTTFELRHIKSNVIKRNQA